VAIIVGFYALQAYFSDIVISFLVKQGKTAEQ
jgi:hypothetical protein